MPEPRTLSVVANQQDRICGGLRRRLGQCTHFSEILGDLEALNPYGNVEDVIYAPDNNKLKLFPNLINEEFL